MFVIQYLLRTLADCVLILSEIMSIWSKKVALPEQLRKATPDYPITS